MLPASAPVSVSITQGRWRRCVILVAVQLMHALHAYIPAPAQCCIETASGNRHPVTVRQRNIEKQQRVHGSSRLTAELFFPNNANQCHTGLERHQHQSMSRARNAHAVWPSTATKLQMLQGGGADMCRSRYVEWRRWLHRRCLNRVTLRLVYSLEEVCGVTLHRDGICCNLFSRSSDASGAQAITPTRPSPGQPPGVHEPEVLSGLWL